jgi:hypothetical protein
MPERVKISANSWAEQKRVVIISGDTSFNVLGYDPNPTTTDASSRPVGLWLKGFATGRANRFGKGWKVGSAKGSKPFLCGDGGRLVGRLGRLVG